MTAKVIALKLNFSIDNYVSQKSHKKDLFPSFRRSTTTPMESSTVCIANLNY